MPYASYILSYYHVAGTNNVSWNLFLQGTLLGFVITLGNQLVYQASAAIAEWAGFRYKDRRDKFYVCLYTFAVFVNTCFDLWTTVLLAYGYDDAFEAEAVEQHALLSPGALARREDLQHALYVQLLAYLWPATLLLPFMAEPVLLWLFPYYLSLWLVRSHTEVGTRDAEKALECWEFDLARYGDNLINTMLCILMLFLSSLHGWQTFAYLTISLVFILCWDHYRFLRATKRSVFATEAMDITAAYLGTVPVALLGAACAAQIYGMMNPNHWLLSRQNMGFSMLWVVVGATVVLHLVLHCLLLYYLVPWLATTEDEPETVPYSECASETPCTWFSGNPVFCLRSKYIYKHENFCVPFRAGKEYLLHKNEKLGLYYERAKMQL